MSLITPMKRQWCVENVKITPIIISSTDITLRRAECKSNNLQANRMGSNSAPL